MSVVMAVSGVKAYNSISSVPSAIKIKAETMVVRCCERWR